MEKYFLSAIWKNLHFQVHQVSLSRMNLPGRMMVLPLSPPHKKFEASDSLPQPSSKAIPALAASTFYSWKKWSFSPPFIGFYRL